MRDDKGKQQILAAVKSPLRPAAEDLILLVLHVVTLRLYFYVTGIFVTTRSIELPFDKLIWLLPPTIVIYHLWYPTLALTGLVLYLKNRAVFRRYLTAMVVVYLSSIACFWAFPTFIPRPDVPGTDIFSRLLTLTYRVDHPYCGFPSLHVGSLTVAAFTVTALFQKKAARLSYLAWCAVIAVTTLTTKQHVFLDLPGGIVFGLFSVRFASGIEQIRRIGRAKSSDTKPAA